MATTTTRTTVIHTETLEVYDCANCGITFGVPQEWDTERRADGRGFYCPNGHVLSYHDSTAKRLEKTLAEKATLEKRVQNTEKWAREAQAAAESELAKRLDADFLARAANGKLSRLEKRIANGVCPCCGRHFTNLERHVATKHPDFAPHGKGKAKESLAVPPAVPQGSMRARVEAAAKTRGLAVVSLTAAQKAEIATELDLPRQRVAMVVSQAKRLAL